MQNIKFNFSKIFSDFSNSRFLKLFTSFFAFISSCFFFCSFLTCFCFLFNRCILSIFRLVICLSRTSSFSSDRRFCTSFFLNCYYSYSFSFKRCAVFQAIPKFIFDFSKLFLASPIFFVVLYFLIDIF